MRARASILRAGATSLGLALGLLGLAAPVANAQATCLFDEATGILQVSLLGSAPAVLARGVDAITLDSVACGTATVTTTETITVAGTGQGQPDDLTVDLGGGPFAPGLQAETDGGEPEIEIAIDLPGGGDVRIGGSGSDDLLTVGTGGTNLNPDEAVGDADVTITGGSVDLTLDGHEGSDTISLTGGDGTGAPVAGVAVEGGVGNDTVLGALGGSTIDGGEGVDTIDYSAASRVDVSLGTGVALPQGGTQDTLAGIEFLVGTAGDDKLVGDGNANMISGGNGNDLIDPYKGDDVVNGGQGNDTVDYSRAARGVEVDLDAGTATGLGADTLNSIENVTGSGGADVLLGSTDGNVLKGGEGADEIRGNAGNDKVTGGLGNDLLFGGADKDTLDGGQGRDQLDGGEGKDTCIPGADPDAWTGCETVKL